MPAQQGTLRLLPTEDRELQGILREIPSDQVRCRAGHHRFAWDETAIGDPLPPTVYAQGQTDGRYRIVDPCPCGVKKVTMTQVGGGLNGDLMSHLIYPVRWVSIPQHLPRGKRVVKREKIRRTEKQVQALIRNASAPVVAPSHGIPQTRFRGVS